MKLIQHFFLISLILMTYDASSQNCSSDAFMDQCATNLSGSNLIKSYEVESMQASEDNPSKFSYVFSKGSTYNVIICDQNIKNNRLIVNLLDRNKKLIASNYNKKTKKYYSSLSYPCGATGVYYIESYFEDSKPASCGVNILSFNKQ